MSNEQDDAKIAARWLWGATTRECKRQTTPIHSDKCPTCGASVEMDASARYSMFQVFAHDIPLPHFADPAVYDRALRELAEPTRKLLVDLQSGFLNGAVLWACHIHASDRSRRGVGTASAIGAAIAAAIAELARAEGAKDADMGPQKPANG